MARSIRYLILGDLVLTEFGKNSVIVNPLLVQRETLLELEYNLMLFKLKGSRNSDKIQTTFINDINSSHKTEAAKKDADYFRKNENALLTDTSKKIC